MALNTPPVAPKKPHSVTHHGVTLTDDYAWLRDPGYPEVSDPEILAHLAAENTWFEERMAPHRPLVDSLFTEMRGRIKEADKSVPQKDGDWLYWIEYEAGAEYKKWWRKPVSGGPDELLLDEVALAAGRDYFRLGAISVSLSGRFLAYSVDQDGSERYTIRFRDLGAEAQPGEAVEGASGKWGDSEVEGTIGNIVWTLQEDAVLYSLCDEHWRHRTIKLHTIGTDPALDPVIYHEQDEGFSCGVALGAQERWIVLQTGDHDTSEVRLIPADDPLAAPILIKPRQSGVEYDVDVRDDTLFIHANDTHENFRLATAPLATPGEWTTLIEGTDAFYLTGFELFRDFYVVEGRRGGLDQIELRWYDEPDRIEPIVFPEASYDAGIGDNPEWATQVLRLGYESMVSPATIFDYHVAERRLDVLKVQEIPSGYDASLYVTERVEIAARDGTTVPVSVVMRRDRKPGGPLHLYGYGAYGIAIPPGFSTTRLSLVDRGFAYAIAHIRGGDDLGRAWYKAGKLERRTNTFTDFVDVANGLVERGFTTPGRISISGGSAGGELMGAVINSDPALWGAVVADVPFVDVLATMLDESLPLTPGEWPEWGNPIEDKAAFELIRSYSPYDQVRRQAYPPLLVTAGLNDPRVTYWEPAKWVARLRELKTDSNELLLKTNMGAGHGGKSGRFESLRETAEEFAFILWQLGLAA